MIRFPDPEFIVETNGSYVVGGFRIHKVNFTEFGQMEKTLNWSNTNAAEQNRVLEMIIEEQAQINQKLTTLFQQAKPEAKKRKFSIRDFLDAHEPKPISMIVSIRADDPQGDEFDDSASSSSVASSPAPILMQNPVNPTYTDTRRRFTQPPQMRPTPEEMAARQARQAEIEASSTTETGRQPVPPDPQPSLASHAPQQPQQQQPQPQDFHQAPINWAETIDRGDAIIQIPHAPSS
ncbi:hypothetical protein OWV82_006414 [Melia azedarach]|uniref:Uncharacterized protein n=1 Tax=Melia azedarach TaxID=155640 RepID=A0ACC1YHZ1_MELAZ|nr:hypothetical protein OWV82_006414 [Melia azedarach]